jgi:hypothetical protein
MAPTNVLVIFSKFAHHGIILEIVLSRFSSGKKFVRKKNVYFYLIKVLRGAVLLEEFFQ